jgi:hypothetical protein
MGVARGWLRAPAPARLRGSMAACGECRFFRMHTQADDGSWIGDCRHQPQRGDFGPDAPICISFLSRNAPIPSALPEAPTRHRSRRVGSGSRPIVRRAAAPEPRAVDGAERDEDGAPISPPRKADHNADLELELEDLDMTRYELKQLLREVLEETDVQLAPKWEGASILLKPADPSLQAKEIPIDSLLHKVVMIRDRLRVLEAKVNAHPKLTDAEKVDLQQYVTRCYGSLTTFNLLFRDKRDQFEGAKGEA